MAHVREVPARAGNLSAIHAKLRSAIELRRHFVTWEPMKRKSRWALKKAMRDLFDLALNISKLLHITIIDLGQDVEVGPGVVGLVVLPGEGEHISTSPLPFLPGLLRMASGQLILDFPHSTNLNH
jgi:hypothetical protein